MPTSIADVNLADWRMGVRGRPQKAGRGKGMISIVDKNASQVPVGEDGLESFLKATSRRSSKIVNPNLVGEGVSSEQEAAKEVPAGSSARHVGDSAEMLMRSEEVLERVAWFVGSTDLLQGIFVLSYLAGCLSGLVCRLLWLG
ncbi:hypothetical protein Dimus_019996 [Dionaea muscipula]